MEINDLKENLNNPYPFKGKKKKWNRFVEKIGKNQEWLKFRPIIFDSSQDNLIIAGNKRWKALKEYGVLTLPKEFVKDCAGMTDEEKRGFELADNYSMGDWDRAMLSLQEMDDWTDMKPIKKSVKRKNKVNQSEADQVKTMRFMFVADDYKTVIEGLRHIHENRETALLSLIRGAEDDMEPFT